MMFLQHYQANNNTLFEIDAQGMHSVHTAEPPRHWSYALAYDEARKQLITVGTSSDDDSLDDEPLETWVWSALDPAHHVVLDLTKLLGAARTTEVTLDGFAVRAETGADAAQPGVALELWNGLGFQRALDHQAPFDRPEPLCFESTDSATLAALEVDRRWPFVLRAAAVATESTRLRTSSFEVRVRYHVGAAAPAMPRRERSFGGPCDPAIWAQALR